MDCSTPIFPVLHSLPVCSNSVHWIGDAIQPPHPLSSSSPPAFSLSQHQGLFHCWFFTSCGQRIGASTSASVLPMNIQDWFPLELICLISLQSKGLSRVCGASVLRCSAFFMVQLSQVYMTTGKTIALTIQTFVSKVVSLLFNMLSRFVIAFLPRSKHLLISCLQSLSAVILEPKKVKSVCFHCFPLYFPWSDGTRCPDPSFLNVEL